MRRKLDRKPAIVDLETRHPQSPSALMQVKIGRLRGIHAIKLGEDGAPTHLGRARFTSEFMTRDRPKGERRFSQSVRLVVQPPDPTESQEAVRRFRKYKDE